jgi:hypothetical protein
MSASSQTRSFGDLGSSVRLARKRTRLDDLSVHALALAKVDQVAGTRVHPCAMNGFESDSDTVKQPQASGK